MRWTKSGILTRLGRTILLGVLALKALPATAEEYPQCPTVPTLEVGATSVATKTGVDAVGKLLGRLGIDINVRTTRDNVLKDNPRADQMLGDATTDRDLRVPRATCNVEVTSGRR